MDVWSMRSLALPRHGVRCQWSSRSLPKQVEARDGALIALEHLALHGQFARSNQRLRRQREYLVESVGRDAHDALGRWPWSCDES